MSSALCTGGGRGKGRGTSESGYTEAEQTAMHSATTSECAATAVIPGRSSVERCVRTTHAADSPGPPPALLSPVPAAQCPTRSVSFGGRLLWCAMLRCRSCVVVVCGRGQPWSAAVQRSCADRRQREQYGHGGDNKTAAGGCEQHDAVTHESREGIDEAPPAVCRFREKLWPLAKSEFASDRTQEHAEGIA